MSVLDDWIISDSKHVTEWDTTDRCVDPQNGCIRVTGYKDEECYIKRIVNNIFDYYQLKFDLTMSGVEVIIIVQ